MKKTKVTIITCIILIMVLSITSCGKANTQEVDNSNKTSESVELVISAAASLKDSIKKLQHIYNEENTDSSIIINFGSSGSLQHQIEQGAEVDVFISASSSKMDVLEEKDLLKADTRIDLLNNSIVLITPKNSSSLSEFNDLTSEQIKTIALGEPNSVPAGKYAYEVLNSFNLVDSINEKIVFAKDVKEVLTWVETGNADAGMVYLSDAQISEKVKIIAVAPENSHKPIVYPAAIINTTKNTDKALNFLKFLSSEKAKTVFEKYGFTFIQ